MTLLWEEAVRQLTCIFNGVLSDTNAPICDGTYRFVCWGLAGDLEYFSNDLHFPHFNSLNPGWFCGVSRAAGSDTPLTDLSLQADWKDSLIGVLPGCFAHPTDHPIMAIPGAARFHAPGDLMHSGHMGQNQQMCGSVLHELLFDGPFEGN